MGIGADLLEITQRVPALEILAHRFVWTIVFLGFLLSWQERWREVIGSLRRRRSALFCLGSGIMVGLNWLLFIWAVNIGHVLETSLGYFMTPIVNVLLGAFILRERLSAWQIASILIALSRYLFLPLATAISRPCAVGLCASFGLYGLLRKQSGTAAIPGLFLEIMFLLPLAIVYLALLASRDALTFACRTSHFPSFLRRVGSSPLFRWFGSVMPRVICVWLRLAFFSISRPALVSFLGFLFITRHSPASISLPFFSLVALVACFCRSGFALACNQTDCGRRHDRDPR